jgi:thioredoxin
MIMSTCPKPVLNCAIVFLAACGLAMSAAGVNAASRPLYDEQANAREDIAAAVAKASRTGRNVVLIFGANW